MVRSPGFSRFEPSEGRTPKRSDDPDGFMFPMHSKKRKGALHEPWMRRADIPVCRFGRLSSRPILKHGTGMSHEPAGWKACATHSRGVQGPMHGIKAERAFHESQGSAGILPAEESEKSSADETSAAACWRQRPARSRFMFRCMRNSGQCGQLARAENYPQFV